MQQENISLQDIWRIAKRRIWTFIIPAGSLTVLALLVAFLLPSVFQSNSTILIEEQEIPRDYVLTTVTGFAEQRLQTITQRIMSATRLLEVINRYGLYTEKRQKWTSEETVDRMRKDIRFETISSDVIDPRTGRATAATIAFRLSYRAGNPAVAQQIANVLTRLSYRAGNPAVAQQIANVLTSLYLEENLKVRQQQTQGASKFLEDEMQDLKSQLEESDKKIAVFKEKHLDNLPELVNFNLQSLDRTERDIDQMQSQLGMLRERESYLQTQLASIPADARDQDRQRLADLRLQLTNLLSRVSEAYPDVPKIRAEIAEIEGRLKISGGETFEDKPDNQAYITLSAQLASTQAEIESVKGQIEGFYKKREEYRQRIEGAPKVEEVYKVLISQRNNVQAKFDELSNKYMEARLAQGLEQDQMGERFTLIEAANLPEKPVSPNRPAIALIGLILGIGAGAGLVALLEYGDNSVRSTEELSRKLRLPVLGGIPEIVTDSQHARMQRRRRMMQLGVLVLLIGGVMVFHFFIMDLDIFWAKLSRRMDI
jgi:polysaccharide chain length determinant protein (PEP-CTERM system associated)